MTTPQLPDHGTTPWLDRYTSLCGEILSEYVTYPQLIEIAMEMERRALPVVLAEVEAVRDAGRLAVTHFKVERDEARAELKQLKADRILSVIFGHHKGAPRPFALYRREDETGVSGTGVVATGAEFEDGMVVLRWSSAFPTSVVFHERGMESVEAIHGHGGKTVVVWLSDELESLAAMETAHAERDAMLPVVEAAKALVADWQAHRATHGGGLIAAVDQYEASDLGPPHAGVAGEEVDHGDDSPR